MKKLFVALMLMPLMALANTWTDRATGINWQYWESEGKVSISEDAIPTSTQGEILIRAKDKWHACSFN